MLTDRVRVVTSLSRAGVGDAATLTTPEVEFTVNCVEVMLKVKEPPSGSLAYTVMTDVPNCQRERTREERREEGERKEGGRKERGEGGRREVREEGGERREVREEGERGEEVRGEDRKDSHDLISGYHVAINAILEVWAHLVVNSR